MPKSELSGTSHRGKGGYWTIDPTHMEKFKNGAFAKGSSTLMRKSWANRTSSLSPSSLPPDTPTLNTQSTPSLSTQETTSSSSKSSSSTDTNTLAAATTIEPCPVMQIHNLLN